MLRVLARMLGGRARNITVIRSESRAAMWLRQTGRSRITKFAANIFAAEIRAWHGEEALWKVFWVYGVAASVTIVALYVVAFYDGRIALRQVRLPLFRRLHNLDPCLGVAMRRQHQGNTLGYARALPDRGLGRKYDSCSDLPPTQPFDQISSILSK